MQDHLSLRHELVLGEITRRREVDLVVVKGDLRSNWNNLFPRELGYSQALNEIGDAFLYAACTIAVAAARGARATCLGSEFEAQQAGQMHWAMYANYFFMMSPLIMSAVNRLLMRWGCSYASLLTPLSHYQVETVLWRRYPDLADLQNSCFNQTREVSYCSRCHKCLKIAMILMALDIDPRQIGIDLETLFLQGSGWGASDPPTAGALAYAAKQVQPNQAARFFRGGKWKQRVGRGEPEAFRAFEAAVERFRPAAEDWPAEYRPQFLKYVLPTLRDRLDAIYRQYFPVIEQQDRAPELARIDEGIAWITAPLMAEEPS